jgi:hypothetical protein
MGLLPSSLVALDAAGRPLSGPKFERIEPFSAEARSLSEANWDEIICSSVAALTDALRAANVLPADSALRLIGRQVEAVDIVFAEVAAGDEEGRAAEALAAEPRRLVLLENKLVRNPEAKREVLAQLLDYAQRAQHQWTTNTLRKSASTAVTDWLGRHAARIDVMLAQGEMLLIIAGDDIDEDLLRLARRFAIGTDPLSLAELCLVSMAVYRRGPERLLVPHVVSAVERHQRQLSIRVTVQSEDGTIVPAHVERDADADVAARRGTLPTNVDVEAFLAKARARLAASVLGDASQYEPRGGARKLLAYWLDDEARFKIHFGGFVRDGWSPIQVGLYVESATQREIWLDRVQRASSRGELPEGTVIRASGKKTVEALTNIPWSQPSELNEALLDRVVAVLLRFVELFGHGTQ